MAHPSPPTRPGPLDKIAGVAAQFERAGGGYLYRQDGHGPAIAVSAQERDTFVSAGGRATLQHLLALVLAGAAAWLLAKRLTAGADDIILSGVFAALWSAAAMLLIVSHDGARRAPARALAGRPVAQPARDPDPTQGAGRGTIIGVMALALLWLATGTIGTAAYRAFFAVTAVLIGGFLLIRRARAYRRLSPAQRAQAVTARRAEAARQRGCDRPASVPAGCAMVLFFVVESIAGIIVLGATLAGVLALAGEPMSDPSGWAFAAGFLLGGAAGLTVMWGIDKLCKRVTGLSAMDEFSWLPIHW